MCGDLQTEFEVANMHLCSKYIVMDTFLSGMRLKLVLHSALVLS